MPVGLKSIQLQTCHIAEPPRATSSHAIPGVSLQKRGAAVHFMSAGTPIPTHSQALPAFFSVRPNSHVYGLACELVARGDDRNVTKIHFYITRFATSQVLCLCGLH